MSDGGGAERDLAFVSYSHEERKWLDWLAIWLKPYVRAGQLQIWADPYIEVGARWEREIQGALSRTRVGVLLTSHNFAASDFIAEVELPALRQAAHTESVTLFCIPLSSVDAAILGLDGYQWARAPDQPLDLLSEPERNRAMVEITKQLVGLFQAKPTFSTSPEGTPRLFVARAVDPSSASLVEPARPVERLQQGGTALGVLHGVPELPPHFVERTAPIAELKGVLFGRKTQRHGISAATKEGLHGQGGIGKTVLAATLAHDEDVRRAFPDGIFWLTLGQEPELIALQQLLLEMATGKRTVLESVDLGAVALRDRLSEKRCLLILDDVWQGAHTTVFDTLGPRGRLVVTTRDREILTALDAFTLSLEVLAPSDARRLLAEWAQQAPDALAPQAEEVAKECGYLPLALSLAGAQIAGGTSWSDLLGALRAGNLEFLDHAHRSIFKSLSLSVRALSPTDAERYRELAVFPEDIAVPEAIILRLWAEAELGELDARKLLRTFANKALLFLTESEGVREVRFHDLQSDYLRLIAGELPTLHALLLKAHYRLLPESESGAARWASLPLGEVYLWRYLMHHVIGSDQRELADALVTDMRWLEMKVAASGVSSLLSDLARVVEQAPSDGNLSVDRALRLEAAWLHQHPEALQGLLYNRLRSEGATPEAIAALLPGLHPPLRLAHPVNFGGGRVFRGHSGFVTACTYSPDGKRILCASNDRTVREWDLTSGEELRRYVGHSAEVKACAYSPDGTRILSASWDKTLREWDRESGNELRRYIGHSGWVCGCAYSPDGKRILSASWDKTLREWDRESGNELRRYTGHSAGLNACAYSPDGKRLLSGSLDKTLREWDRVSGNELRRYTGHSNWVSACAYSPDGERILSASADTTVREWDSVSGNELRHYVGHTAAVNACRYSPDGTRILSASWDNSLWEWDRVSGNEIRRYVGHSSGVNACAYSPDGKRILSAALDKTLREWDAASGKELPAYEAHASGVGGCVYSRDGTRILSASNDKTLREWDRASGSELRRYEGHSAEVRACAYAPDEARILSASNDMTLREWDRVSGNEIRRYEGHSGFVTACAYSPDGTCILSGAWDGTLREWDRALGSERRRFEGHSGFVTACAYSPDGTRILSASYDKTLREWDRASGNELLQYEGHPSLVMAHAYSPDGTRILSGAWDGTLREWDRASGREIQRFHGHSSIVTACVYSPDGACILSASSDNSLKIWSSETGECLDTAYGAASFDCIAATRGHIAAGDALGNVWILDCDWL